MPWKARTACALRTCGWLERSQVIRTTLAHKRRTCITVVGLLDREIAADGTQWTTTEAAGDAHGVAATTEADAAGHCRVA